MNIRKPLTIMGFAITCGLWAEQGLSEEIISFVGDPDGLGFGVPDGGTVPVPGLFDNRSPAEMMATDGAQQTDSATNTTTLMGSGVIIDFTDIVHVFSIPRNATIESATIILGIGSLQENDNDPNTQNILEDELLLDGAIVPEAFEALVQSILDFDADYTIELSPDHFPDLIDGVATLRINTNVLGGAFLDTEPVYLDYSQLIVNFSVPAVPALNKFSGGILVLLFAIVGLFQYWSRRRGRV